MATQFSSLPITLNCRVQVEMIDSTGQAEQAEFILAPARQADIKSGLLDENAPLGRLLLGHHAGEVLPYRVGDLARVRILAVYAGEQAVPSDAALKRRQAVQKAEAQSEITSQMIFSTASGSKWGEYNVDVDKLLKDDDQ
jgi:hypothetical protein